MASEARKRSTAARPIPLAPPVTIAVRPARSIRFIAYSLPPASPRATEAAGLDDQVVRRLEALAIIGWADAGGEMLLAAAPDQAALGDGEPLVPPSAGAGPWQIRRE